ncbi:MAG: hypothetical protein QME27_05610, partial [Syntrophaceae bacterium]|nr:hypothetical protein [Syntrophaceae bacterium]
IAHPTLQVSYGSILAMLLIGAVFVLAMGPLEVHYAQENRDGWFDHNVALSEITHGENISILATPGLFTQWDYYYSGTASLFTSEKALQEQICSNGRDTYVFVPASTIPSASMLEANNIQHFLNKYGELVAESYRGFNGYRVEKGRFCTDTLAFSDAAMEAWA